MATNLETIKQDIINAQQAKSRDEAAKLLAKAIQKAITSAESTTIIPSGSSAGTHKGIIS